MRVDRVTLAGTPETDAWLFPLGDGRSCSGHPDSEALRYRDRDRRDKPGDDVMWYEVLCYYQNYP